MPSKGRAFYIKRWMAFHHDVGVGRNDENEPPIVSRWVSNTFVEETNKVLDVMRHAIREWKRVREAASTYGLITCQSQKSTFRLQQR